jgi:hypothetical protein
METYRLYILDSFNGDIAQERRFTANDDDTAVWIAEGLQHSRGMELWHQGSKIRAWEPLLEGAPRDEIQIIATMPN